MKDKRKRKKKQKGVKALAEMLGLTQGHVSRVMSGERRSPRVEAAWRKMRAK